MGPSPRTVKDVGERPYEKGLCRSIEWSEGGGSPVITSQG